VNSLSDFFTIITPFLFILFLFGGVWATLNLVSRRNSQMASRLERMTRPTSMGSMASFELPDPGKLAKESRNKQIAEVVGNWGDVLKPKSDQEQSALKLKLANAGFRSDMAVSVYLGLRIAALAVFGVIGLTIFTPKFGLASKDALLSVVKYTAILVGIGFYLPVLVLNFLVSQRKQEIFLTLPDALDLLVVCVESGLGLDAAMRRVSEEMKDHTKILSEELQLSNFQLQMGRPRRDVLHDLGLRTGVDDVRSLAAILIQADKFGSSIAQALRVQSDSMRTRRRQLAEEKAAKTAVQLIFPLVLFIFPGIFVVLVGPAALKIMDTILAPK
jgi:tight adherence protein C